MTEQSENSPLRPPRLTIPFLQEKLEENIVEVNTSNDQRKQNHWGFSMSNAFVTHFMLLGFKKKSTYG